MIDDKKLKESELEQVCGGDDSGTGGKRKSVVNPNGTDFCSDPCMYLVIKHLDFLTDVYMLSKTGKIAKVVFESKSGYVLYKDLL